MALACDADHKRPCRLCRRRRPRRSLATPTIRGRAGFAGAAVLGARIDSRAMAEGWFDELAELVRIPSVSADPTHAGDVERAAEWLAAFVRGGGGDAEVVRTDTHPLIVGELPASNRAAAPTVLVYGHVDVQPPDPLELWESEPFAPEVRGEWLYGRGVADDKGQLYMLLKAATELARAGRLPEPLRAGIAPPTEEEIAGWAQLVPGAQRLVEAGARPVNARAGEEFYRRTTAE